MLSSFIALSAAMMTPIESPPPPVSIAAMEEQIPSRVTLSQTAPDSAELIPAQALQETESDIDESAEQARVPSDPTIATDSEPVDPPAPVVETPAPSEPITRPAPDPTIVAPTERRAILKTAANAMARVETAEGRFVQVDAYGAVSEGVFYLQRPGRMRFEYDAPIPLLLASDGTTVALQDTELETVDRVPLASTPLGLLLDNELDFETEAEVQRVQKANGVAAVTVTDPTDAADGELTLIFDAGNYELIGWRVHDSNGGLTTVQLQDVRTGMRLSPRLFIIEEFDDRDDDRR